MQQAEIIMNATKGQQRNSGAIPSLFDVPTRGKTTLGKRPSAPIRNSDNKRARVHVMEAARNLPQVVTRMIGLTEGKTGRTRKERTRLRKRIPTKRSQRLKSQLPWERSTILPNLQKI